MNEGGKDEGRERGREGRKDVPKDGLGGLSEHVHGDFVEAQAGFLGDEGGAGGDGDVGVVVLAEDCVSKRFMCG